MRFIFLGFAVLAVFIAVLRQLSCSLGASSPWLSYIYFYGLGWPVFILAFYLMIRQGALNLKNKSDRLWGFLIFFGLFAFCILHGVWIYLAETSPYKGV